MSLSVMIIRRHLRREERNVLRIIRRAIRDADNPFEAISNSQFIDLYRFPKNLCKHLIEEITPFMGQRRKIHGVPSHIRVLCALRFFASGCFQRAVEQDIFSSLSQSVVSRCITEISEAINKIANKYVMFPNEDEYGPVKRRFFDIASFPGIIGAIDGTHIKIVSPAKDIEHVYYCRKGGHSKNVQIVCDADYVILNVNARFGGTAHDSYIWRKSLLKTLLQNRYAQGARNCWLIGDSGYPIQPWLMTPISTPNSQAEENYNRAHKITRSVVERCIGILKSRFRCLSKERTLYYSPEKAGLIINACAVLHNMLMLAKVPYEEFIEDEESDQEEFHHLDPEDILQEGRNTLNNLILNNFSL